MHRTTRHSAGASLELQPQGVLAVRLFGPITRGALIHVKQDIVQRFPRQRMATFVADYTKSAVLLTGAELGAVLDGEAVMESSVCVPAAFVVPAGLVDLFVEHSVRMAMRGIARRVFTDQQAAFQYAQQMTVQQQY
jgi:hypothetical protein